MWKWKFKVNFFVESQGKATGECIRMKRGPRTGTQWLKKDLWVEGRNIQKFLRPIYEVGSCPRRKVKFLKVQHGHQYQIGQVIKELKSILVIEDKNEIFEPNDKNFGGMVAGQKPE